MPRSRRTRIRRGAAAIVLIAAALGASVLPPPAQGSADVPPGELRRLVAAVQVIKQEFVTPVEDARLAQGCATRMRARAGAAGGEALTDLTQIPPLLRRLHTPPGGEASAMRLVDACLAGMAAALDGRSWYRTGDEPREVTRGAPDRGRNGSSSIPRRRCRRRSAAPASGRGHAVRQLGGADSPRAGDGWRRRHAHLHPPAEVAQPVIPASPAAKAVDA